MCWYNTARALIPWQRRDIDHQYVLGCHGASDERDSADQSVNIRGTGNHEFVPFRVNKMELLNICPPGKLRAFVHGVHMRTGSKVARQVKDYGVFGL